MFSCLTSLFWRGILMIFLFYGGVMQNSSRNIPVLSIWELLCNLTHVKSVSLIFWSCHDNVLYTDLYRKPTDRNRLLRADSCHPLPLKNCLSYSQLCWMKRMCKKQSDFDQNMAEAQRKWKERGGTKKVRLILPLRKLKLRHGQSYKNKHSCILIMRYYKGIVHKHWYITRLRWRYR
jgi:hypothetical protein